MPRHSADPRYDSFSTALTLALVTRGSGFVRRSQVFKGNVNEASTLKEMLESLETPRDARVVMDRGIATKDRIDWLHKEGYRYIVVSRERSILMSSRPRLFRRPRAVT